MSSVMAFDLKSRIIIMIRVTILEIVLVIDDSTGWTFSYLWEMMAKLDMSTARRRPKSPRSLSGTSAHLTMVTQSWSWMDDSHPFRSLSIAPLPPPSHSWDKAISDSDLETPRWRSWVWSKGKVIQSAQYDINSLRIISYQSDQQFRR